MLFPPLYFLASTILLVSAAYPHGIGSTNFYIILTLNTLASLGLLTTMKGD